MRSKAWLDPDWTLLTLATGWTHYAPQNGPVRVRRDIQGRIHFRGLASNTSAGANTIPVTLLSPFMPVDTIVVPIVVSTTGAAESLSWAWINSGAGPSPGRILLGASISNGGWVSLGAIPPLPSINMP